MNLDTRHLFAKMRHIVYKAVVVVVYDLILEFDHHFASMWLYIQSQPTFFIHIQHFNLSIAYLLSIQALKDKNERTFLSTVNMGRRNLFYPKNDCKLIKYVLVT